MISSFQTLYFRVYWHSNSSWFLNSSDMFWRSSISKLIQSSLGCFYQRNIFLRHSERVIFIFLFREWWLFWKLSHYSFWVFLFQFFNVWVSIWF